MSAGRYRWLLLVVLSVAYLLEQGVRQIYNATMPQIRLDFHVTDAQLGMVGTVFGAVFGLFILFAGFSADFLGRKRVVVIGTAVFSLGILLAGFSGGLASLVVFYGVINALGQCCVAPPCFSLICQHFEKERCTAMGVFSSCNYLGVVVCSVFAGYIGGIGPGVWRWSFWIFGAFGILWAWLLQKVLQSDSATKPAAKDCPTFKDAFWALGRKPTAVMLVLAFGMFIYTNLGIYLWVPTYLIRTFAGLSLAKAAFHAVFWSSIGSMIGLFVTARVTDWLVVHRPMVRFEMTILGLVLCTTTVAGIARAQTLSGCCVGLLAFGFARGVLECTVYPAMFDVIVPRFRAACTGMAGCWAFLFGSMAPAALGWLSQRFTLRAGVLSLTFFEVVGVILLVFARLRFLRRDMLVTEEGKKKK